jgi:hypothetical protein
MDRPANDIKLDDVEYQNGFNAIKNLVLSKEEIYSTLLKDATEYKTLIYKIEKNREKIEDLGQENIRLTEQLGMLQPIMSKLQEAFSYDIPKIKEEGEKSRRWNDKEYDIVRPLFKEVKEGKLEALISITLFEKVCDRLTLDHSISQKMKLNELARKVFKANIGYTEFKKELLEASKVTLVSKEENLGTLSSIQKQLSSQDIDDIDPRDVYEMAGIEVLNVFDKKEIKTVLGKLRAKGLLKEDAISNFKKNILNKSKNSNFSKIPMKTRNEILKVVEEI